MPITVSVIDDLNRADAADLGANWTADPFGDGGTPTPKLTTNQIEAKPGYRQGYYNVATYNSASGDLEFAFDVPTIMSNGGQAYLGVVQQPGAGTADGYMAQITYQSASNEAWEFFKVVNGTFTTIAGPASLVNSAAGDKLILRRIASSNTWQFIKDTAGTETVVLSVVDNSVSGLFNVTVGCFDSASTGRLDNIAAGVVAAAGGATVVAPVVDGVGDLVTPAVAADATVVAPPVDGTGALPVTAAVSASVDAPVIDATGAVPAPAVSGNAAADGTVVAPVVDGVGDLPDPAVSAGAGVTAPVADGTGDLANPATTPATAGGSGGALALLGAG